MISTVFQCLLQTHIGHQCSFPRVREGLSYTDSMSELQHQVRPKFRLELQSQTPATIVS